MTSLPSTATASGDALRCQPSRLAPARAYSRGRRAAQAPWAWPARETTGQAACGKAYDARWCRQACRRRGIWPRIARRVVESSQRQGRHRWVVERTLAWLRSYRRLRIRDERRADIHQAFLKLDCALIPFNHLQKGTSKNWLIRNNVRA